jgi:hypothetical protein
MNSACIKPVVFDSHGFNPQRSSVQCRPRSRLACRQEADGLTTAGNDAIGGKP